MQSPPLLHSAGLFLPRFLQLLQRRAELKKRENPASLFKPKQTHSGLLIQHESVECREMSGGSTPTASGWALARRRQRRLKTSASSVFYCPFL